MKNLLIFLAILSGFYLVGIFFRDKQWKDFKFMAVKHTNICRAVAAIIIILQHVAGSFGLRYFTPLGGIGVAMFLILSGYGLNESYKKKRGGGVLADKDYTGICAVFNHCDCYNGYPALQRC